MSPRHILSALCLCALGAGLAAPAAQAQADVSPPRWGEGRILVQPRAGVSEEDLERVLRHHFSRNKGRFSSLEVRLVEVPVRFEELVAQALSRDPRVAFAEPDHRFALQRTPDDPQYPSQWHLPKIGAPEAWAASLGEGIVVAVLDTGVDGSHPDLTAQLIPGWNFCDGNSDTRDVHGHGTQVAGVVAAQSDNGIGVASVAWRASVLPVRIGYADGTAYASTIASGLTWAADQGARVANISYDVAGSRTIAKAAGYFRAGGGVVVVAAGNTGGFVDAPNDPNMVYVSATTSQDRLASWSSHGLHVNLSAPGAGMVTTARGGGYATVSGTSFSSPCVAGVAALLLAANSGLLPAEVESILFETAEDLGSEGWDEYYGHGRVNAASAVAAALGIHGQDEQAPVVFFLSPTGGDEVSGVVPVDLHASDDVGVAFVDLHVAGAHYARAADAPYRFTVDFGSRPPGPVDVTAYAYDAAGNRSAPARITVTVTSENIPPTADAGGDQTVTEGSEVVLDGSKSSDPDGTLAAYRWTQTTGPSVALSDPTSARARFVAPAFDSSAATLSFELRVTDDGGESDTDTVLVTIVGGAWETGENEFAAPTGSENTPSASGGGGGSGCFLTALTDR